MKVVSLTIQMLWPKLKFMQTDRETDREENYYIPSSEILEFPSVMNFDIITSDDINFHFHFLP